MLIPFAYYDFFNTEENIRELCFFNRINDLTYFKECVFKKKIYLQVFYYHGTPVIHLGLNFQYENPVHMDNSLFNAVTVKNEQYYHLISFKFL